MNNTLALSISVILELPENTATDPHLLALKIESRAREYGEAASASRAAWDMYSDAIDNEDPHEEIESLYAAALEWEVKVARACYYWNEAKSERLALVN